MSEVKECEVLEMAWMHESGEEGRRGALRQVVLQSELQGGVYRFDLECGHALDVRLGDGHEVRVHQARCPVCEI